MCRNTLILFFLPFVCQAAFSRNDHAFTIAKLLLILLFLFLSRSHKITFCTTSSHKTILSIVLNSFKTWKLYPFSSEFKRLEALRQIWHWLPVKPHKMSLPKFLPHCFLSPYNRQLQASKIIFLYFEIALFYPASRLRTLKSP